jgi:hypothetical protein
MEADLRRVIALGREDLACYATTLWLVFCHRITRASKAGPAGSAAPQPGGVGQFGQFQYGRFLLPIRRSTRSA